MIKKGSIYKHFKGEYYKIICIGYHSETNEKMVVYQNVETDKIYIRPYEMFISDVDKEKYPNVTQKKRFELVRPVSVKNSNSGDDYFFPDWGQDYSLEDYFSITTDIEKAYVKGFMDAREET